MIFNTLDLKLLFQKGRRRTEQFINAFKKGDLNRKKDKTFQSYQDFLKKSDNKFRRYNRKLKAYEPTIPRGKLKQSKEFEDFVLSLNESLNTGRSAKEEKQRKKIKSKYHLSDAALDEMETIGYDVEEYASDSDMAKKMHIDTAIKIFDIDKTNSKLMMHINKIGRNLDRYNLRQIYDDIFLLSERSNKKGSAFDEI